MEYVKKKKREGRTMCGEKTKGESEDRWKQESGRMRGKKTGCGERREGWRDKVEKMERTKKHTRNGNEEVKCMSEDKGKEEGGCLELRKRDGEGKKVGSYRKKRLESVENVKKKG